MSPEELNEPKLVSVFLRSTYTIVDEPSTNHLVSWSEDGMSFIVHDPKRLAHEVFPRHFKHSKFSSWLRQMNMYRFTKVSKPGQWIFHHPLFQRGRADLMESINRKPVHRPETVKEDAKVLTDEIRTLKRQRDDLGDEVLLLREQQDNTTARLERVTSENAQLWSMLRAHEEQQKSIQKNISTIIKMLSDKKDKNTDECDLAELAPPVKRRKTAGPTPTADAVPSRSFAPAAADFDLSAFGLNFDSPLFDDQHVVPSSEPVMESWLEDIIRTYDDSTVAAVFTSSPAAASPTAGEVPSVNEPTPLHFGSSKAAASLVPLPMEMDEQLEFGADVDAAGTVSKQGFIFAAEPTAYFDGVREYDSGGASELDCDEVPNGPSAARPRKPPPKARPRSPPDLPRRSARNNKNARSNASNNNDNNRSSFHSSSPDDFSKFPPKLEGYNSAECMEARRRQCPPLTHQRLQNHGQHARIAVRTQGCRLQDAHDARASLLSLERPSVHVIRLASPSTFSCPSQARRSTAFGRSCEASMGGHFITYASTRPVPSCEASSCIELRPTAFREARVRKLAQELAVSWQQAVDVAAAAKRLEQSVSTCVASQVVAQTYAALLSCCAVALALQPAPQQRQQSMMVC